MEFRFTSFWVLAGWLLVSQNLIAKDNSPDFETDIAPLLIKRCVECHQGKNPSGNLILTTKEGFLKGGESEEVIDFSAPKESYFLDRVHEGEMPPTKKGKSQKLPDEEIALLERWLVNGAKWPENRTLDYFERTNELRAGLDWWSLQPVSRPALPRLKSVAQPENPIDAFIYARLEKEKMVPAPKADKKTLLRRLYYDLVGLPPTFEQIKKFENDSSPNAWENKVDELLDSPQYGERWGRYWLDLVRYADTSGYERDQEKSFAWKYRDWVVDSFNSDMPYHQFIVEQLAGDEIPESNEQAVIATGFLRLGTWNDEPNDPKDYIYDRLEDMIHTTSSAFLGMTVKCARCHAHKFDPITQEDYYRMGTAFWAGPLASRSSKFLGGPNSKELGFEKVLGWTDLNRTSKALNMLKNGEREHPLQEIAPASLSLVPQLEKTFEPPPEDAKTTHRRLQLAQWITDPDHPLTARILVNRLWLHHFGQGIVRTPNNFGFLADPPTHPELLDWLASEFKEGGWTIKRMHKLILTSQVWQQSSVSPQLAEYQKRDAGNRFWWRAERRRLDAEALRDSMLAASGKLDLQMGGPGFRPTISKEALEGLSMKSGAWKASPLKDQNRRSIYTYFKRGLLPPLMTTFDLCDSTQSCGKRDVTTVPTQALSLMNNSFVHLQSEALAESILEGTGDTNSKVYQIWNRLYGRDPSGEEIDLAMQHVLKQQKRFENLQQKKSVQSVDELANVSESLDQSMVLHLQADQGVTVDPEGRVSSWKDLSGHHHDALQLDVKSQPVLSNKGFNDNLALKFDGKGRFLDINGSLLKNQECTIIAVVNDQGTPGHRSILSNWNGKAGNATTSLFLGLTGEDSVRFSDNYSNAGQIKKRNHPFILSAINHSDESAVFLNGLVIASRESSLSPRNLSTDWVIGQQGNINGEFWNGSIAEIRVYKKSLSAKERLFVEKEISERYGIPFNKLPPPKEKSPEMLALASLVHVLLNSNEFLYVD